MEWHDGGKSEKSEVAPYAVCCEEPANNDELKCVMKALTEYLLDHGEYCEGKPHEGWYAHRKVAR